MSCNEGETKDAGFKQKNPKWTEKKLEQARQNVFLNKLLQKRFLFQTHHMCGGVLAVPAGFAAVASALAATSPSRKVSGAQWRQIQRVAACGKSHGQGQGGP